jgi:hypothetical protein
MSDHYKHISDKAARKAADELARVRAEQRVQARSKLEHQHRANSAQQSTLFIDPANDGLDSRMLQ